MLRSQYSAWGRRDGSVSQRSPPTEVLAHRTGRMCRDILNTCVRNTEEAEKATHPAHNEAPSGRGQGKGLWVMIEESELAKTFRHDEQKKVDAPISDANPLFDLEEDRTDQVSPSMEQEDSDILVQARACKEELDDYFSRSPSSSTSPAGASVQLDPELEKRAKGVLKTISKMIDSSDNPSRLQELLSLNDDITKSLSRFNASSQGWKRIGLGIHINIGDEKPDAVPNGHAVSGDEDQPVTPRIDKGKGKAEPEPEPVEKVLTPTSGVPALEEDEDADPEGTPEALVEDLVSPTDR